MQEASGVSAIKLWWNQLRQMWGGWTLVQRVSIAVAAIVCLLAVGLVGAWSLQSQYVPLAADLTPTTAAELVSALDTAGVPNKLNFSGSAVLVPKQDLSRARLAAGKVIDIGSDSSEDLEGSVWADPTLHHVRLLRQTEQRLARSIGQFEFVRSATVHVSVPEPSPFLRDQSPPTASVVVELRAGGLMNRQDAAAIVALVAHGVEGLSPSQVTVMDTKGRILSSQEPVEGDVAAQLEYRRRVEADLAAKAETLLSEMLGPGRAVVRVTAAVDFTKTQTQKTTYDPTGKVKVSETVKSESTSNGKPASTPTPGGAGPTQTTASAGTSKIEENTTSYENAKTQDTIQEAPGKLVRLTIAAVVQLPEKPADGSAPAITAEAVQGLIKQAVGFDATRSDEITVVESNLVGAAPLEATPAGLPWGKYEQLIRSASLGLAALLAFVMGWIVLRRFRPTVSAVTDGAGTENSADRIASLASRARENPEAVAQALNAWLAASKGGETSATVPFKKAG
jgi:flagellar M-ring protein FliF